MRLLMSKKVAKGESGVGVAWGWGPTRKAAIQSWAPIWAGEVKAGEESFLGLRPPQKHSYPRGSAQPLLDPTYKVRLCLLRRGGGGPRPPGV